MALILNDRYPGETRSPSPQYPWGSFQDRTSPTSTDGTKLQQDWSNDFFAFNWKLLKEAGMTPNGKIDTVEESQYFDALIKVIQDNSQKIELSDSIIGVRSDVAASEKAVGDLNKTKVNLAGDTMSGDLMIETLNSPRITLRNATIPANNRGAKVSFENVAGTGTFMTTDNNDGNAVKHTLPSRSGVIGLGNSTNGSSNGWLKDEVTGIITQWGYVGRGSVSLITFPTAFTQACFSMTTTPYQPRTGVQGDAQLNIVNLGKVSAQCYYQETEASHSHLVEGFYWMAIGK